MKRVILIGAAAVAFGLGLAAAHASQRVVDMAASAGNFSPRGHANDVSAAKRKKKKVRAVRSARDSKGTGGGRGGESGSGSKM
jgi:Spy/CpxP family protein refolding chaperone